MSNKEDLYLAAQERLVDGVGLYVRAFPSSAELLSEGIEICKSIYHSGESDVDAVSVVVMELFPRDNRMVIDTIQQLTVQILTDFMYIAHAVSMHVATSLYTESVIAGTHTVTLSTTAISSKAANAFIQRTTDYSEYALNLGRVLKCAPNVAALIHDEIKSGIQFYHLA